MKRFAIVSVLTLVLAASSSAALAADDATGDGPAEVERGIATLRVTSKLDDTCNIWINGALRASIGPFGNSGVISVAPDIPDQATDVLVTCTSNGSFHRTVGGTQRHCEFAIGPESGHTLTSENCP